jgi:hypothetical protein
MLDNRYSIDVRRGISNRELLTSRSLDDEDGRRMSGTDLPMRHLAEYHLPYPKVSVEVNE